jgi:hypothetical protein
VETETSSPKCAAKIFIFIDSDVWMGMIFIDVKFAEAGFGAVLRS